MRGLVPRTYLVLAGVVAGAAGIAVSHAAASLMAIRVSPLTAVGEAIIQITPGGVAEALIQLVGQYDKPLLLAGTTLGILALSALAGIFAQRGQLLSVLIFVAMGLVGGAAMLTREGAKSYDLIPVALGTVTWIVALSFMVDALGGRTTAGSGARSKDASAGPPARRVGHDRRTFLVRTGIVATAAVMAGLSEQLFGRARRGVETARSLLRLPITPGRLPGGADLDVEGIEPWRTGNDVFYRIDTALVVPTVDPNQWKIRIHGMVESELELSYRNLVDREMTEAWVTLCCVSNAVGGDLIGNAWWSGVRIADLLEQAGVDPRADAVLQTSKDGWTCGTPLAALTDGRNAMLAVAMNGEPLPVEHGFPVRMVVPGLYGYVSATKWIVDIEVTRFDRISAYWTERGWAEKGPVKTQSRIDVPRGGQDLEVGSRRIGGSAWAQHTGIEQVEYRLDGDAWKTAELGRVPGIDTWVQWTATVDLSEGDHTLAVRATDRSGSTQTSVERGVVPDGATGWHTVEFSAG